MAGISIKEEPTSLSLSCANCDLPQSESSMNLFTSVLPAGSSPGASYDEELPTIQEALSLLYGLKFRLTKDSKLVSMEEEEVGGILGLCPKCTDGLRAQYQAHVHFSIGLCAPTGQLYPRFEKSGMRMQSLDLGREEDDEDWDNNSPRSKRLAAKLQRQFLLEKEARVVLTRIDTDMEYEPRPGTSRSSRGAIRTSPISSYSAPMDSAQLSQQAREVLNRIKANAAQRNHLRTSSSSTAPSPAQNLAAVENMFPPQVRSQFKSTLRKIIKTLKENQNKPPGDLFSIPGKPFIFPGVDASGN